MLSSNNKVYNIKSNYVDNSIATKKLFYNLDNARFKKNQSEFKDWLNEVIYLNGSDMLNEDSYVSNLERIHTFNDNIIRILKKHGLKIKNEKEFKNELATFIYNLS
tara:strand:- start:8129 stop:8446 length:318 start_codon:yes stop_codon:yes gene_type:complete